MKVGLVSVAMLASARPSPAQTLRTQFIFHVFVDANYGDDVLASGLNPAALAAAGPLAPLGLHQDPGPVGGNPPIQGRLTSAPYSFRTVGAALAYIPVACPGGFPWPDGTGQIVEKVVIHVQPGLYGPQIGGTPVVDPNSGQVWNGEAFPLVIPHGVSIRGTSALDVIFDARGTPVSIFDVEANTLRHEFDFINGVTIRGARSVESSPLGTGAGVFIHGTGPSSMTVSNCFIVGNTIGIAVVADNETASHTPRIINNTIAWNAVGIWNGTFDPNGNKSFGVNTIQIINNVIDASPPDVVRYPLPVSSFEGVSELETLVSSLTGGAIVNQCVNAWPVGYQNFVLAVENWPATTRIGADPGMTITMPATVDLTPWIGQGNIGRTGVTRAILFVNDALFVRLGVDHSPHDFRLAPQVRSENGVLAANPLVNQGVAITGGITAVNMAPVPITQSPGPSSGGNWIDVPATIHCWDWDCEGFGNPRIDTRAGFAAGPFTAIDMGADEMGELVMAGYIDSTRIYSHSVPNGLGITDHTRVFFLDLPTGPYTRPVFNWLIGGYQATPSIYYPWWTHIQTPVNAVPGTNYTRGNATPQSSRFVLTDPLGLPNRSRPAFMRNLICDVSPHLVQDPHPLWAVLWNGWVDVFGQGLTRINDVYASHPWYDGFLDPVTGSGGAFDNPFLFHNPVWYPMASVNDWMVGYHRVTLGLSSPPGSYFLVGQPSYLLGGLPTTTFGPFGTCTPTVAGNYTVDALGVGDTGTNCPDALPWFPGLVGLGMRMNCQRSTSGGVFSGNLQTFLVVTTNTLNPIDEGLWEGRSRQVGDSERMRESSRALPRAVEWARRNGGR